LNWTDILKTIFKHEAIIVIVKGNWKTGKTSLSLAIAEHLLKLNLIQIAGTNIEIEETKNIKMITDMPTLKEFHFDHPTRPKHKAYIFDESGKLTSRRGAMTKINRAWFEFIPELSKGRCKLIVVTQSEFLTDSIFSNTQFTKAHFTTYKYGRRYDVKVESELLKFIPSIYFKSFPKCDITYFPYASAKFTLERKEFKHEFLCCEIARDYAIHGKSTTVIANERGYKSREPIIRLIKRHIRHTFGVLPDADILEYRAEQGLEAKIKD